MQGLWLRRVGFALSLAFALGYLPYRVYRKSGLRRYLDLRAELAELAARDRRLHRETLRLRAELEAAAPPPAFSGGSRRADPLPLPLAAVERAARDELGLVRPGELVFQIVPEPTP